MDIKFFTESANDVLLEVELKPAQATQFEQEYFKKTNVYPTTGSHYQHQHNKWGAEYRIYFNCTGDLNDELSAIGINVEQGARFYNQELKFRVNNREFFWALIGAGYRLGNN